MTKWKDTYFSRGKLLSTADVVSIGLTEQDGGVAERAQGTANNVADALGRLAEGLESKGLLTTAEVQQVFEVYRFEPTDD